MPNFSLGIGNLFGRFAKDEKQPERRIGSTPGQGPRSTGGGQSGSQAFSERFPTPKPIGGPLSGLGEAASNFGMTAIGLPEKLIMGLRETSQDVQDITGRTYGTAKDALETVVSIPGTLTESVTAPVGQLSKDILPLAAIAAALVLLK